MRKLAKKNSTSFEDLCVYALEAANEEKGKNTRKKTTTSVKPNTPKRDVVRQMEDKKKKILRLREEIKKHPEDENLYNSLGFELNQIGQYEEAIIEFDKAIGVNPNYSFPHNNKGYSLLKLKKFDEAEKCITKSLEIDENNSYAYKNLALLKFERGKNAALEDLEKADALGFQLKYGNDVEEIRSRLKLFKVEKQDSYVD